MVRKKKKERREELPDSEKEEVTLHPDVKKSAWLVAFLGVAVLFILAGTGQAGPLGGGFYSFFNKALGWGYYLLPLVFLMLAFSFIQSERRRIFGLTIIAGLLFVASGLGFIDIVSPGAGGLAGELVGALQNPFGTTASLVITLTVLIVSFLVVLNKPIKFRRREKQLIEGGDEAFVAPAEEPVKGGIDEVEEEPGRDEVLKTVIKMESGGKSPLKILARPAKIKNYVPPPLSLLSSTLEKPTIGDLRANANIIKRTLDGFGIPVEMGEINVGPTVTRYTLKPAEGVKLSRLTALHQDLSLSLAAHPVRIEAPIPGKSLVGIEVPNKAAALVRLGSLLLYPDFQKAAPLTFVLGRNVSGEPIFTDIAKMPHLLVAGATGSGKSILIHSLIISLLYKNSPDMLKLIMIDPKRVELSVYDGIPHLLSPVITDNKKALGVLRWAVSEMDRRYEILLQAGARDIKSYNNGNEKLPYLLIVIDELADLMASFGREVEGSIIRLAQMSRATGLHLVVSTQRPSVEVITGLIKANITSRVALQVASQVDSRTILDNAGAEKLLGSGDLLFVSAELSKPRRIQGAYVSEEEVKKVASFIKENNKAEIEEELPSFEVENGGASGIVPDFEDYESGDDDELYNEAVELVRSAKKASASLLQRRLRVGYARAARLLDIMEERGVVGPGEGAKPREVF